MPYADGYLAGLKTCLALVIVSNLVYLYHNLTLSSMPGDKHHNWEHMTPNSPADDKLYDISGYRGELRVEVLRTYYEHDKGFKEFIDSLNPDEKILDLGTGRGSALIRFLREIGKAENIISLDLDKRNLDRQSESDFEGNNLVQADAQALPFADHSLDIITENFLSADNYTVSGDKIDSEITRVLKPGGYYITPHPIYKSSFELVADGDEAKVCKYIPEE